MAWSSEADSSGDDEEDISVFMLHNAAEAGNTSTLQDILSELSNAAEAYRATGVLDTKDFNLCTPLHVAILNGQLECLRLLLEAGAETSVRCEGSPLLVLAVSVGALPDLRDFALAAVELLLQHNCSPWDRDENGRLALHWAAEVGLSEVVPVLIAKGIAEMRADHGDDGVDPLLMIAVEDDEGDTPLHLAAVAQQASSLRALISHYNLPLVSLCNKKKATPLHSAAAGGCAVCVFVLLKACPASLAAMDNMQRTPQQVAEVSTHHHLLQLLSDPLAVGAGEEVIAALQPTSRLPTCVLAPEGCKNHRTFPEPLTRGLCFGLPPENTLRLQVLIEPKHGILRTTEFKDVTFDTDATAAELSDVLKVHEWSYVKRIQKTCLSIPDAPSTVGHLDGDTALSNGTWCAALEAAGAVCRAVDKVLQGQAKNAFCAVRPPGHHAGPTGVVTCKNDSQGSHGFCLLNNVAIGAAYALSTWRHSGVKRVCIIDFDVHHGNGTEACCVNTIPSMRKHSFRTPFSEGYQTFPCYKPWLGATDPDTIFFASVQGYGKRDHGSEGWVYPGSGATADSKPPPLVPGAPPLNQAGIPEDPRSEFAANPEAEVAPTEAPRIINVGIPGPGRKVGLWRRSWRDKILPAVVAHNPDLILISAGFDAHRKDDINFGYLGVTEVDYEWITEQIVQVANLCCEGRVVSVLEGGYRIQGGIVSAFARSVAAHTRALNRATGRCWSADECQRERALEEEEQRRKDLAAAAKLQAAMAAREALAAAEAADNTAGAEPTAPLPALSASPEKDEDMEARPKRRRANVDYVALNEKFQKETGVGDHDVSERKEEDM